MKPTIAPTTPQQTRITAAAAALSSARSAFDTAASARAALVSTLATLETQRQTHEGNARSGNDAARIALENVLIQKTRTVESIETATTALAPYTAALRAATMAGEDLINELFGADFVTQLGDLVQTAMSPFLHNAGNARALVQQTDELRELTRFLNGPIDQTVEQVAAAADTYRDALSALGNDGEVFVFVGAA